MGEKHQSQEGAEPEGAETMEPEVEGDAEAASSSESGTGGSPLRTAAMGAAAGAAVGGAAGAAAQAIRSRRGEGGEEDSEAGAEQKE